jgi:hypothetical protein
VESGHEFANPMIKRMGTLLRPLFEWPEAEMLISNEVSIRIWPAIEKNLRVESQPF